MKKKILIISLCAVLAAAAVILSFVLGRKTAPGAGGAPTIEIAEFSESNKTVDKYVKDYEAGGTVNPEYLQKCYGLSPSAAEDFFKNPGEWLCYDLFINITNSSDRDLYFFGVNCDDNGKDGVYVFTETTSILGIPSGGKNQICISVLVSDGDLSDEQVEKLVRSKALSVSCAESDEPAENEFFKANLK